MHLGNISSLTYEQGHRNCVCAFLSFLEVKTVAKTTFLPLCERICELHANSVLLRKTSLSTRTTAVRRAMLPLILRSQRLFHSNSCFSEH